MIKGSSKLKLGFLCFLAAIFVTAPLAGIVLAADNNPEGDFGLQVSPSPLVQTAKPGVSTSTEVHITNTGSNTEKLKLELRSFDFDNDTGKVQLRESVPNDVKDWVTFSQPTFTIKSGEVITEKINFNVPQNAGFSYTFAIAISRQNVAKPASGQKALEGSVAIFTLLSIDKPGANRSFSVAEFSADKRLYEYLPATFNVKLRSVGNTIVMPAGDIYIQRSSKSSNPIAVIPFNGNQSYLLPKTERTFSTSWNNGFPVFVSEKPAANAAAKMRLSWDWSQTGHIRFGRYVAKMVAIYNDGQRDVPIQAEVSFWVIPWKLILILIGVIAVIIIGFITITRGVFRVAKHTSGHRKSGRRGSHE